MKKKSILQPIALFLCGVFLVTAMFQCRKQGVLADSYDRSYKETPDTAVFSPFYESNKVPGADVTPDVNDIVKTRSVQNIINEYCATANCHGGPIAPKFATYTDVLKYVNPGNPLSSKLWTLITTNDFNKAMPPVNLNHELSTKDKNIIYGWIKNGAKEYPALEDYRPVAISLLVNGCGSGNCHNQATATGVWARSGLLTGITTADTVKFTVTGSSSSYCQLINTTKMNQVWTAYKDSVKLFYADTIANASFRPWKTFGSPTTLQSCRGPLSDYDDIIMDIMYPKGNRTGTTVRYTDPITGKKFYVRNTYLDATSAMVTRVDSTLQIANPQTGIWSTSLQGGMARADGNLSPSEIAIIKGWYFTDPNIPDVWKYGKNNTGIFRYKKTMNVLTKTF
jgi:hypothetical protein